MQVQNIVRRVYGRVLSDVVTGLPYTLRDIVQMWTEVSKNLNVY